MNSHNQTSIWLFDSPLTSYVDALKDHFIQGRYAPRTIEQYMYHIAHFSNWLKQSSYDAQYINEKLINKFIYKHLPQCTCTKKGNHFNTRAALGHILTVLRANAIIAYPFVKITPIDEELQCFDDHLNHIKGLAPGTRRDYIGIIRHMLFEQFSDHAVVFSMIKADDVRIFVAQQIKRYNYPSSASMLVCALHSYFRFRATCGDPIHHLIGVVCYPANWQLSSLPETLSSTEVSSLLKSLDHKRASAKRTKAIVHCALDLGLRSCEIANLNLDDIGWDTATIILRKTKSKREDIMPLPEATGHAIADYLKFERPKDMHVRTVFVRKIAPLDQPLKADRIRKIIRQAYIHAGLPYTRSHLLRHTMASRLLEGGSSLKEVADVLRHRSLNTTMIYAKLDSKNLAAVALPWPGSIL